jgi:F0F1-type ATP synthase assembly protein I
MVFLSGLSLLVSMIGLYILPFASFATKDDQQQKDFINKASRKIRIHKENKEPEKSESKKPSPQFMLLLQTIIIGELVGLFFLTLTDNPTKYRILFFNSVILLIASLGCSGLTLFNVWLKKKTNIQFRVILQVITLVLGIFLMKLSFREEVPVSRGYFDAPMYFYYGTVVVALGTMLINVISGNKTEKTEFNFNNYLILVIVVGLVIGTGLLITSSIIF